jgi:diguanylate cyclase
MADIIFASVIAATGTDMAARNTRPGVKASPGSCFVRQSLFVGSCSANERTYDRVAPGVHRPRGLSEEILRLEQQVAAAQARAQIAARRLALLRTTNRRLRHRLVEALHAACHDSLTGLPNRRLLTDRLKQAMAQADRAGKQAAVLLLDLDGFKTINDRFGHQAGDHLLRQVAQRLGKCTRAVDTVCRYGGDEFVVVLENVTGQDAIARATAKINAALMMPFRIESHDVELSVSIGVAVYPRDAGCDQELVKQADLAMFRTKHGQ